MQIGRLGDSSAPSTDSGAWLDYVTVGFLGLIVWALLYSRKHYTD